MTRTLEEIIGKKHIEALRRPIDDARGLPGAAYTSEEFFELEQERMFRRTWMCVGFECDIPNPGDAMPITVGGLPIILVRSKKGEVKAFHNVCRHRATLVLTEPGKGLTSLTCPYHAWAYDLDGKLKATPYFDGSRGGDKQGRFDKEKYGLVPVRCAVWYHWIFVNMDGNAPPLSEHVRPMVELLDGQDLGACRVGLREDWEFKANWKLQNDNWETYHHIWVHKGIFNKMSNEVDLKTGEPWTLTQQNGTVVTLTRRPGGPPFPRPKSKLPMIPVPEGKERFGGTNVIFPNVTMTIAGNHIASVVTDPIAPDKTIAKMGFFFVGDAAKSKSHAADRKRTLDRWMGPTRKKGDLGGIRSQDMDIWEVQQIARKSPIADEVVFSPIWEANIHHFQKMLVDYLED